MYKVAPPKQILRIYEMKSLAIVSLSVVLFLVPRSEAALITGATGAPPVAGPWTLDNVTLGGTAAAPIITLDMTVHRLHEGFTVLFNTQTVDTTGGVEIIVPHTINVNVTNGLTYGNPAHNANFNGYDVVMQSTGGVGGTFIPGTPLPSPGAFGFTYPTPPATNIPNGWRFGGLNGGGGTLAVGSISQTSFRYDLRTAPGRTAGNTDLVSLRFTANPEPSTMVLAGLALIPCGVVARRRRKNQVVTEAV